MGKFFISKDGSTYLHPTKIESNSYHKSWAGQLFRSLNLIEQYPKRDGSGVFFDSENMKDFFIPYQELVVELMGTLDIYYHYVNNVVCTQSNAPNIRLGEVMGFSVVKTDQIRESVAGYRKGYDPFYKQKCESMVARLKEMITALEALDDKQWPQGAVMKVVLQRQSSLTFSKDIVIKSLNEFLEVLDNRVTSFKNFFDFNPSDYKLKDSSRVLDNKKLAQEFSLYFIYSSANKGWLGLKRTRATSKAVYAWAWVKNISDAQSFSVPIDRALEEAGIREQSSISQVFVDSSVKRVEHHNVSQSDQRILELDIGVVKRDVEKALEDTVDSASGRSSGDAESKDAQPERAKVRKI